MVSKRAISHLERFSPNNKERGEKSKYPNKVSGKMRRIAPHERLKKRGEKVFKGSV